MSKRSVDSYVKFSNYNGGDAPSQQNVAGGIDMSDRFQNAPPQTQNDIPPQESGHRVHKLESDRLFHLLSNPSYHYTIEEKPCKILVKVYTDWCGPCKTISPKIKELSNDPNHLDILFVEVDGEKICENLSRYINVSSVPVFFGFVAGKQYKDFIVGPDFPKIKKMCEEMSSI